jgi:hypothetical protein
VAYSLGKCNVKRLEHPKHGPNGEGDIAMGGVDDRMLVVTASMGSKIIIERVETCACHVFTYLAAVGAVESFDIIFWVARLRRSNACELVVPAPWGWA